jgi:hypothetical protein
MTTLFMAFQNEGRSVDVKYFSPSRMAIRTERAFSMMMVLGATQAM